MAGASASATRCEIDAPNLPCAQPTTDRSRPHAEWTSRIRSEGGRISGGRAPIQRGRARRAPLQGWKRWKFAIEFAIEFLLEDVLEPLLVVVRFLVAMYFLLRNFV